MKRSASLYASIFAVMLAWGLILALHPNQVLAQVPEKIRIGMISGNSAAAYQNATTVTFFVNGEYEVVDLTALPGTGIIGNPAAGELWQVYYLPGGLKIGMNGKIFDKIFTGPVVVREKSHQSTNWVSLKNYIFNNNTANIEKLYRGAMEFKNNGSSVVVINELPFEEYLYGVVGKEVSDSWPLEAIKAQATAARTYAVANFNKRIVEGYNLLAATADQAYAGVSLHEANVIKAVSDTADKVIFYDGKPITAVYHSTSGGHTENNENVWTSGSPLPYLRGKPDPYSTDMGLATWNYTTTIDDVRDKLLQCGSIIGPILDFQLEKFTSGRVKTVIIKDINGNTISKSGDEFGKLFNPGFYTYLTNESFMSRFFEIKTQLLQKPVLTVLDGKGQLTFVEGNLLQGVTDDKGAVTVNGTSAEFYVLSALETTFRNKAPTGSVIFAGHGWGHGSGMSQWGAYQMAKQGKTYVDILKFYYTGVEISDY